MGRRATSGGSALESPRVPLSSIAFNPRNPRLSPEPNSEFVQSIKMYGVQQPITVIRYELYLSRYPDLETAIGAAHWVVVHGNRRLAGAVQAKLDEIPVIVSAELAREDRVDESVLIENVHREDLPPLQEALLVQQLVDKHGSAQTVAEALAKSKGWVSQRLSLLKLVPQLQSKLAAKELSVASARELASLPQTRQMDAFEAGPPYKTKRSPATTADPDGAVEPARQQLVPEGETAKRISSAEPAPSAVPDSSAAVYDVNHGSDAATEPTSEVYHVNHDGQVASRRSGRNGELASLLRTTSAHDLVQTICETYSPEQCTEIARQLQS